MIAGLREGDFGGSSISLAFLDGDFLAGDFLAGDFLAGDFLAGDLRAALGAALGAGEMFRETRAGDLEGELRPRSFGGLSSGTVAFAGRPNFLTSFPDFEVFILKTQMPTYKLEIINSERQKFHEIDMRDKFYL